MYIQSNRDLSKFNSTPSQPGVRGTPPIEAQARECRAGLWAGTFQKLSK
jgi:hypothetical protein